MCEYLGAPGPALLQYSVSCGSNVKYVVHNKYLANRENKFYLRSLIVRNHAELVVKLNGAVVLQKKLRHIQPSEMICISCPIGCHITPQWDEKEPLE